MVIGSIGVFFSRIIKAAISRQREFLADASAVQFTRNPNGIASALNRIRLEGSNLDSRHAEEISHMCFATSLQSLENQLFATHPELKTRIKRIDPLFDFSNAAQKTQRVDAPARFTPDVENWSQSPAHAKLPIGAASLLSETVGSPNIRHIDYAEAVHQRIPENLLKRARFPEGALAIIYALLINQNPDNIKQAIAFLHDQEPELFVDEILDSYNYIAALSPIFYLPLFDIAINAVHGIEPEKRKELVRNANRIAHLDGKFTLSEFVYLTLIEKYLTVNVNHQKKISRYADVLDHITVV
ncbi:MAG TPA: M48 family metalloprotease, partial [Pseudomonadales bacterium]|nr:M48 family metalloprotease [Pseudomonadales bacterium]